MILKKNPTSNKNTLMYNNLKSINWGQESEYHKIYLTLHDTGKDFFFSDSENT